MLTLVPKLGPDPGLLATCIPKLDAALGGGVARGTLNLVVGSTGHGRSMMLGHIAVGAVQRGLRIAYADLLPDRDLTIQRMFANITGIPTQDIGGNVPSGVVTEYAPKIVPRVRGFRKMTEGFAEVRDWLLSLEGGTDALFFDSLNDLDCTVFEAGEMVRSLADELDLWCWSTSCLSAPPTPADLAQLRQNAQKFYAAEFVLAIREYEDGSQRHVRYSSVKERAGVKPFEFSEPQDFARARMVVRK